LSLALIAGCSAKTTIETTEMTPRPLPKVVIGPGDVLDVKFFDLPELNESQSVRPDGKITLQLVGDVDVAGKSPADITADLTKLFEPHLQKPKVTVLVRSLRSNRVFVGGEVRTPGSYDLSDGMTPLEAVILAGGFETRSARIDNVVLIRHSEGRRYGYTLNLKDAQSAAKSNDFYLEPYDIVWVPRTAISKVDQWVDQHINQIIPRFGLIYTYRVGDATIGVDLRH
jgi:protein involved in polysaccharide export with SLBB domain